jgi:hypothetical protein
LPATLLRLAIGAIRADTKDERAQLLILLATRRESASVSQKENGTLPMSANSSPLSCRGHAVEIGIALRKAGIGVWQARCSEAEPVTLTP